MEGKIGGNVIERIDITLDDLPEGSILRLYRVEDYYVQIGYIETGKLDSEGTRSKGIAFSCCTCPSGFLNLAFSLCAKKPKACQHVDMVIAMEAQNVMAI